MCLLSFADEMLRIVAAALCGGTNCDRREEADSPPRRVISRRTAKYKMLRLSLNTGAGAVTPETMDALTELIDAGVR